MSSWLLHCGGVVVLRESSSSNKLHVNPFPCPSVDERVDWHLQEGTHTLYVCPHPWVYYFPPSAPPGLLDIVSEQANKHIFQLLLIIFLLNI